MILASKDLPIGSEWMAGEGSQIPKPRFRFEDKKIQYDQKKAKHQNGCTVFGNLTAVSALTGYKFTKAEQDDILDIAIKRGFNPAWGWVTNKAVDLVREYWNARNPDNQLMSVREHAFSPAWQSLIDNGYQMVISGQLSSDYWQDFSKDGELDVVPDSNGKYGHIFSGYKKNSEIYKIVDNYVQTFKFNVYEVEDFEFKELHSRLNSDKVKYLPANYFYMFKDDFEAVNGGELKISNWAIESAKKYSWVFDEFNPKRLVDMNRFQHVMVKLNKLEKVGDMTEERLCVLLDRLISE